MVLALADAIPSHCLSNKASLSILATLASTSVINLNIEFGLPSTIEQIPRLYTLTLYLPKVFKVY